MQVRLLITAAVVAALAGSFGARPARAYDYTAPVPLHPVASFDPASGVVPFPNNLLFSGTTDLTLNIPIADPTSPSAAPQLALNALDGFSTIAPWTTTFSDPIDASTLVPGDSVHVFKVKLSSFGGAVAAVDSELVFPTDYVVALAPSDPTGRTLAIVPTQPLLESTAYMVVLTNGIKNAATGEAVRASFVYRLAERTTPLCTNGQSTVSIIPTASACALEPVRQLTNAQEAAAASQGIDPSSIVLSWVATTQSITPSLTILQAGVEQAAPASTVIAPTGTTLADLGIGLPPIADIYIGAISVPYYLTAPDFTATPSDCSVTADGATPCPPLTTNWNAAPGAYVMPFDQAGLDPTSTNLTFANPVPVATSTQAIPLVMTVPNARSGKVRPAAGWPVVIFQHGITRNRTDAFAIAGTLAAQGFAVVAIDLPLHGITDRTNPFYIGNTPLAAYGAHERTFDIDLQDNSTGAPGPDGAIDPSGSYFINLSHLLTSRDNLRQGVADLMTLAHAIPTFHIDAGTDFDGTRISFVGQSLGSIVGTMFMALNPDVETAVLNVPGGGIANLLEASPSFGPVIRAGLAQAGLTPGTPDYAAFFVAAQTAIDSGDPINYASPLNGTQIGAKRLLLQEVVGGGDVLPDQVIPNRVDGAPLSGTEPLIAALGLGDITGTVQSDNGIRGAVRFLQGEHGSILDPTDFPAATAEMQGEMASMLVTQGTTVVVANPSIIVGTGSQ